MDDKSAVEAPFRYREGTAPDPKTSMSVNGITCYTSERFTACAMGSSATFHDSDVIIQQLLLDIFTEVNGHMAAVFVWDQGPLNYNVSVVPSNRINFAAPYMLDILFSLRRPLHSRYPSFSSSLGSSLWQFPSSCSSLSRRDQPIAILGTWKLPSQRGSCLAKHTWVTWSSSLYATHRQQSICDF